MSLFDCVNLELNKRKTFDNFYFAAKLLIKSETKIITDEIFTYDRRWKTRQDDSLQPVIVN
jgi:hypothetical protein